jgi:hydroxypyruvate isomerase
MAQFSANLGFLWTELSLPDAIRAAAAAGFGAVECHWPYGVPPADVRAALDATGLPMLGLNTVRGDTGGLAAIPGRGAEARAAIDQAIDYAVTVGAANVHVMAGMATGPASDAAYRDALQYACDRAAPHRIGVLIEPLNHHDAPGYHLTGSDQAADVIDRVGRANLKILFDCYHVQIMEGDVTRRLSRHLAHIGHVQIAAVPDRGEPDAGELHYPHIYRHLHDIGWTTPLGAEYRPRHGSTEAGLGWLGSARDG